MRKEISPELYNYNKFPGPEFKQMGSKIIAENFEFELVENYKEAFDLTAFHQRFSEILNKFDYIVFIRMRKLRKMQRKSAVCKTIC